MEKAKYQIAIQTCMEVFDYLIKNNLFVYDSGKDFQKSRIFINEHGFIKETQSRRGTWENSKKELVPTMYVLYLLIQNIETALKTYDIPSNPDTNYASLKSDSEKKYKSYNDILMLIKKMKNIQSEVNDTGKYDNIYINFNLKNHPLALRKIECYAKLEEELKISTYELLQVDEYGYPVTPFNRELTFDEDGNPISTVPEYKFAKESTYVDWEEFKECVINRYLYILEEKGFDMTEPYNNYKSVLGLEGRTK